MLDTIKTIEVGATECASHSDAAKFLNAQWRWKTFREHNTEEIIKLSILYVPIPFKYDENQGGNDLAFTRVNGKPRLSDHKLVEISERKSM